MFKSRLLVMSALALASPFGGACVKAPEPLQSDAHTVVDRGAATLPPSGGAVSFGTWGDAFIPESGVQKPTPVNCTLERPTGANVQAGAELLRLSCGPHMDFAEELRFTIHLDALDAEHRKGLDGLKAGQDLELTYVDQPDDPRTPAHARVSPDGRSIGLQLRHFSTFSISQISDALELDAPRSFSTSSGAVGETTKIYYTPLNNEKVLTSSGGSGPCAAPWGNDGGLKDEACRFYTWKRVLTLLIRQPDSRGSQEIDGISQKILAQAEPAGEATNSAGKITQMFTLGDGFADRVESSISGWNQSYGTAPLWERMIFLLDALPQIEHLTLSAEVIQTLVGLALAQGQEKNRLDALDALFFDTGEPSGAWLELGLLDDGAFRDAYLEVHDEVLAQQDTQLQTLIGHLADANTDSVVDLSFIADIIDFGPKWLMLRIWGNTHLGRALVAPLSFGFEAVHSFERFHDNHKMRALLTTLLIRLEAPVSVDEWLTNGIRTDMDYKIQGSQAEVIEYAQRELHLLAERHFSANNPTDDPTDDPFYKALSWWADRTIFDDKWCFGKTGSLELRNETGCDGDTVSDRELRASFSLQSAEEHQAVLQRVRSNLLNGAIPDRSPDDADQANADAEPVRMPIDEMMVEYCATPRDEGEPSFVDGDCSSQFTTVWAGSYAGVHREVGSGCHSGFDVGVGCGTPVRASFHGVVDPRIPNNATITNEGWGGRVIIRVDQENDLEPVYFILAHLQKIFVSPGDQVTPDTIIGEVGNTGASTGCHLHMQLDRDTWRSDGVTTFISPYWPSTGANTHVGCNLDDYTYDPLRFLVDAIKGDQP